LRRTEQDAESAVISKQFAKKKNGIRRINETVDWNVLETEKKGFDS
jgi:hypothetical protein